jgi:hypothetical protein
MLGLDRKECPATISIAMKGGNQSSNWSATDCGFDQFKYRTVVHLEKGVQMQPEMGKSSTHEFELRI